MVGMLFSTMMITSSMLIAQVFLHIFHTFKSYFHFQAWDWYSYMSILFVLLFVISFATGPGMFLFIYLIKIISPFNFRLDPMVLRQRVVPIKCTRKCKYYCCVHQLALHIFFGLLSETGREF
jgi:hypothetical protein